MQCQMLSVQKGQGPCHGQGQDPCHVDIIGVIAVVVFGAIISKTCAV